ncbi:hypothetical protein [Occallatibacter savannae]|uniref:hypothetical protein n=1 Tax=Occallatibacter savannae TaxID=1002691 RepID=UPI000D69BAEA|nr:hypothetical protein [Occallatibacter savannae]
MGDVEINELVAQIGDLTPVAQDVLRDEMKKRGISAEAENPRVRTRHRADGAEVHWAENNDSSDDELDPTSEDGVFDYTWKVELCHCESLDEAAGRSEMLRRAGVDSWIPRPDRFGGNIRIDVGADQLEQARNILEQPIPQDILDQLKAEVESLDYEIPTCPECGAPDPTLESVEPTNNWLCESCGHAWSDPVADPAAASGPAN